MDLWGTLQSVGSAALDNAGSIAKVVASPALAAAEYLGDNVAPEMAGTELHRRGPEAQNKYGSAYAGENVDADGNTRGWSAGAGLMNGVEVLPGLKEDFMTGNANFGGWTDRDGRTNAGFGAEVAGTKFSHENGGWDDPGFDIGAGTASANFSTNKDTTGFGLQANLLEGSSTFGDKENNFRLGASAGVGFAGRLHHGDADGDGIRELGFGLDAGPLSFDIRSELLAQGFDALGNAGDAAGQALKDAPEAIGNLIDNAPELAMNGLNSVNDALGGMPGQALDAMSNAPGAALDVLGGAARGVAEVLPSLPSVSLPSVSMPSVSMPSMPSMPSLW